MTSNPSLSFPSILSTKTGLRLAVAIACIVAACLLAGCQGDPGEPGAAETEAKTSPETAGSAAEPAPALGAEAAQAMSEAEPSDPGEPLRHGQREQLRDQMLERRREVLAGRDIEGEGAARRSVSPRSEWWENEALAEQLALSDQQITRIAAAATELEQSRSDARQALATSQRDLVQALVGESPGSAQALIEQRRRQAVALADAEAAWLESLVDTLNADQLALLTRQHPQLIMGRAVR